MWEKFYEFLKFLDRKIEKNPEDFYFTIEMDLDLYKFCRDINFIPENGFFNFKGKSFGLG